MENFIHFIKSFIASILLACLITFNVHAQENSQNGTLQSINFMEGRWVGTFKGGPIEAAWTAPAGDNVVGFIRMMKDNKATMYELFAFEQTVNGPVALIKHFKPGMISMEEKEQSDRYKFIEANNNQATFEKEDGSVRIIYELRSKNQLVFQLGKPEENNWKFEDLFVFDRIK